MAEFSGFPPNRDAGAVFCRPRNRLVKNDPRASRGRTGRLATPSAKIDQQRTVQTLPKMSKISRPRTRTPSCSPLPPGEGPGVRGAAKRRPITAIREHPASILDHRKPHTGASRRLDPPCKNTGKTPYWLMFSILEHRFCIPQPRRTGFPTCPSLLDSRASAIESSRRSWRFAFKFMHVARTCT